MLYVSITAKIGNGLELSLGNWEESVAFGAVSILESSNRLIGENFVMVTTSGRTK